jgi:hypothetical protein
VLSETRQCTSAIRDRGYPAHAVVPGVMTHIVVRSERRVAACDAPSVTALAGYGQQRTIIDFVRYASLSEEKISVKLRDRIAAGPGDEPANCHIIAQLMLSGETDYRLPAPSYSQDRNDGSSAPKLDAPAMAGGVILLTVNGRSCARAGDARPQCRRDQGNRRTEPASVNRFSSLAPGSTKKAAPGAARSRKGQI